MSFYSPARPSTDRDIELMVNGAPMFPVFPGLQRGQLIPGTAQQFSYLPGQQPESGVLTSAGTAVNNVTTALPFAKGNINGAGQYELQGSMAGRVYLVQATAAGFLLASDSPLVGSPSYWTVATQASIPPAANTYPGVPLNAGDVRLIIMAPSTGWLQWIATTTGSLVCTELF